MKITPKLHQRNLYASSLIYNSKTFLKNKPISKQQDLENFEILRSPCFPTSAAKDHRRLSSPSPITSPPPPRKLTARKDPTPPTMMHPLRWSGALEAVHPDPKINQNHLFPLLENPSPLCRHTSWRSPMDRISSPPSHGYAIIEQPVFACCPVRESFPTSHSNNPPCTNTAITFNGRFDLLSISATILPSSITSSSLEGSEGVTDFLARIPATRFAVSLAGPRGQTVGGVVIGPLLAAGTVYIIAASFNNPLYHRLPMEEDDPARSSGGVSASAAREQSPASGGGDSGQHHAEPSMAADSLPVYSCHLPSDVIWAPIPRQASRHSPLY
ncbi:hypothetical protein L2E82_47115 [Cichorium intybus]|uniref:Uncharacterized protein n=1 Tax=Cichorium intybus TaxID=13427 RepID=A0ACB8YUL4_CICIN|nr:hypothetical protein L2E82_47115 [Cichorium intybus]